MAVDNPDKKIQYFFIQLTKFAKHIPAKMEKSKAGWAGQL
jgi:hypothetical protein